MKNIFDAVKGGNFAEISKELNTALGGKLDSVISSANTHSSGSNVQLTNSKLLDGVGGLLGATAVGGVLGALFGGKKAKKMAKKAALVGGTAAAGALAWKFYQQWAENKQNTAGQASSGYAQSTQSHSFGDVPPPTQTSIPTTGYTPAAAPHLAIEDRAGLLLLEAMVFAARADGHIDEEEQAYIRNAVESLFPDREMALVLNDLLQKPIDPQSLAAKVTSPEEAADLYRLSCAAINIDSFMERSYLDGLAQALKINETHKNTLEQEALAVRRSMDA